jgi:hypothetical protein
MVELIRKGTVKKSFTDFAYDLHTVRYRQFNPFTDNFVFDIHHYGKVLPGLIKDPRKYFVEQPQIKSLMDKLR